MMQEKLHSAAELIEYIDKVGLLPLLRMVPGLDWSAEEVVDEDCRYVVLPDGGWEWPLWEWKGRLSERADAPTASSSRARRRSSVRSGTRLLQLSPKHSPLPRGREHRGGHHRDFEDER